MRALWEIYLNHNLEPFIELLNNEDNDYIKLIQNLILFYTELNLFDNHIYIIPLLILYQLKISTKITRDIFSRISLKPIFYPKINDTEN